MDEQPITRYERDMVTRNKCPRCRDSLDTVPLLGWSAVKSNSYIPAHAQFSLDAAAEFIHSAYDSYGVMLVGSCLERRDYRDVDVRCVLPDEEFESLFPKDHSQVLRPRWQVQCLAISAWLRDLTGLNVSCSGSMSWQVMQQLNSKGERNLDEKTIEALASGEPDPHAESLFKLLPCPHCGKEPRVYHGCSKGKLGDCVECDECDLENDDEGWEYVPWPDAVARWNEYVTKIQARLNAR